MPGPDAAALKVFISYSRQDCAAFAEELRIGLELLGFDPFLDRHDIAAAEDWEKRLEGLIQSSDTVVFVISPAGVASERCNWEVDKATALSKRLIPVVAIPVPDPDVPAALSRLNYVFFHESHSFARSLGALAQALRADLDWIRDHTRLGELAQRWHERGRLDALLLRGAELELANAWIAGWRAGAPEPTDAHRTFIAASAESEIARLTLERQKVEEMARAQASRAKALAEREQAVRTLSRRTTVGVVAAGTLTLAAAGLAYWGVDAERRFRSARERAEEAQRRSVDAAIRKETMRTDIEGQLVAFAASPGQYAMDGPPDGNSPFTATLIAELDDAQASLQLAVTRSIRKILDDTMFQQRPFLQSDLNGDIYLLQQPASRRCKALIVSVDTAGKKYSFPNVGRDAAAWDKLLTRAGFETVRVTNPTKAELLAAFDALRFLAVERPQGAALPNTLGLLFFSGGGVEIAGESYLTPRDVDVTSAETARKSAVRFRDMSDALRRKAAASVAILDTAFPDIDKALQQ